MYEILFIHFISMTGTCFGLKASHRSKPVKDRVNHLFVNKRSVYAAAPESGWWEETVMSFQPERGISVERRGTHQGSSPLAPSTGKRLHKQRGGITCRGGNSETLATHPVVYVFLGGVCKLSYCRLRHANLMLISQ